MMMEYVPRQSLIHSLHPLTKLAWSMVVMILSLILNAPLYLIGIILSVVVVGMIGEVGKETISYLATMTAMSLTVFILQVFFRPGGQVLFSVFPPSWPLVGGQLPITVGGVLYGTAMSLRVLCIISPFPVILSTTQPRDIVVTLVETLRVPYDYAFMFTTALRFVPIMIAEITTISQAQRSRAYATEGWNPIRKLKAFGPIAMPIMFIAIEKASRLGLSMDLRGYGSSERTCLRIFKLRLADGIALTLMVCSIASAIVLVLSGNGRMVLPQ